MTRVSSMGDSLRQARSRLALSWEATRGNWKDKRAREFEERYQVPLDRATLSFERSITRLDKELGEIAKQLPQ